MKLSVGGIKDISTIDYPEEVVSVLFTCGCPFRCPFCQNWQLLDYKNCIDKEIEEIIEKLEEYSDFVDGVCITGGEPTLQDKGLIEFLKQAKHLGLLKLDTNGFYPKIVEKILDLEVISYIAIDIKAPLEQNEYGIACGKLDLEEKIIANVKETINLIITNPSVIFEARTTIVPRLIDKTSQIEKIASSLQGVRKYVLQQFRPDGGTLDPKFKELEIPSREKILELAKVAKKYIEDVRIRTLINGEEKI